MRRLIVFFTLIAARVAAFAWGGYTSANEKSAIAAVALNYMDAYYTADAGRMQQTLHPEFHKRTLRNVNGRFEIREDTVQSMIEGVRLGTGKAIPAAERVQKVEVLDVYKDDVYKDAASVKVVTGRWIDYMHLSRFNGEWRVLDVVLQYTSKS